MTPFATLEAEACETFVRRPFTAFLEWTRRNLANEVGDGSLWRIGVVLGSSWNTVHLEVAMIGRADPSIMTSRSRWDILYLDISSLMLRLDFKFGAERGRA